MGKPRERMTDGEYLRDLAERLMRIPVVHGTDQADVERLQFIASHLEDGEPHF
jgi:hypothetical protein